MNRVTIGEIDAALSRVNSCLAKQEIHLGQRYGYSALDLYEKDTGCMKATLVTGCTRREVYDYLSAMEKMAELLDVENGGLE